jgi:hypothetical protein
MAAVDHHRLLASAIAGRSIGLRKSDDDTTRTYSDGHTIFLPRSVGEEAEHWPAVTAQAVLIAAGSLEARLLRRLLGRPATAQRYLYLEVVRASHVLKDRLPWGFTERAELRVMPRTTSASASLSLAATRVPLPMAPDYFGTVRPLLALKRAIAEPGLAALSSARELDEEDEGESSTILRLLKNTFAAGNPLSNLLNDILGAGNKKGDGPDRELDASGGSEIPVGRVERVLRRGINAVFSALPAGRQDDDVALTGYSLKYPEWDFHTQCYRRDWVSVHEVEAARADGGSQHPYAFQHPSRELRRQLGTLGLDRQMRGGQSEGSDLDVRPLIDCAIDVRAGHSPTYPNFFRAALPTRRDLAVNVVLDISGSTGERRPDGHSAFEDQLQVAYQLGFTLDSLGDTVAMMGFHSWGRESARIVRIKRYDERWSLRVAERLRLLDPVGYTRIGAAVRHGHHVLRTQIRLPHRLLILVTDGVAYDRDYELEYAATDTSKALEEARNAGTACIAVSVGSSMRTAELAQVFGGGNILAVDDVAQVSTRIRALCRHALAAVANRHWSRAGLPVVGIASHIESSKLDKMA